jgi:hypothetical protein
MKRPTDQDGKSKTASAVDEAAYPEQHEIQDSEIAAGPTHDEIAQRAREIWESRGCPEGTADSDWREAEEELRQGGSSREDLRRQRQETGSLQR